MYKYVEKGKDNLKSIKIKNYKVTRKRVVYAFLAIVLVVTSALFMREEVSAQGNFFAEVSDFFAPRNTETLAGGRLHSHFEDNVSWVYGRQANLDIFVENYMITEYRRLSDGSYDLGLDGQPVVVREMGEPIFVRVRLYEIIELLGGTDGETVIGTIPAAGDMTQVATWAPRLPENVSDPYSDLFRSLWTWEQNTDPAHINQIWYVPTFNRNAYSQETDVRGASFDPRSVEFPLNPNTNSTNIRHGTGLAFPLAAGGLLGGEWAESSTTHTSFLYLDHATFSTQTLSARQTVLPTATILMEEWERLDENEQIGNFWVLDTDGWAYWSAPLYPGTSTGVLLDSVTSYMPADLTSFIEEEPTSLRYNIHANSQMTTAAYWEMVFIEQQGDDGRAPITEAGIALMKTITGQERPFYMFISSRLPGFHANGMPAEDMGFNDSSLGQLQEISPILHARALLYGDPITRATVVNDARNLGNIGTMTLPFFQAHPNRPIALAMFDHFLGGSGADFRNTALSAYTRNHPSSVNFIEHVERELHAYLQANGGNLNGIQLDLPLWQRLENNRPRFTRDEDRHNGLVIMIHDTWGRSVEIRDFTFDGESYSGVMRIVVWDHFGMDTGDVLAERSPLEQLLAPTAFHSWYVLQHYTGTGGAYRPMVTWLEWYISFSGRVP